MDWIKDHFWWILGGWVLLSFLFLLLWLLLVKVAERALSRVEDYDG